MHGKIPSIGDASRSWTGFSTELLQTGKLTKLFKGILQSVNWVGMTDIRGFRWIIAKGATTIFWCSGVENNGGSSYCSAQARLGAVIAFRCKASCINIRLYAKERENHRFPTRMTIIRITTYNFTKTRLILKVSSLN
jgi:hypothetical protein